MPDQRSLGAIHHQRVSDTPRVFARAAQVHHHSQQGTTISSAGGSVQTEGERGSSPSAAVRSSHNQSDLCRPQKRRRLETDYRPEIPELPYSTASLQDGGPVHAAKHHQSGVVHGEIGPKGCVLNHPCGSRILEPSNLPSRSTTQLDAVPVPPIRALYRTIHLFKSYKACNPVPTSVRHTPNYLSRRFVTGSSYQRSTIGGPFNSHMVAYQSRVSNKYPKVHHSSHLSSGVSGVHSGHRQHGNFSPSTQVALYPEESISSSFSGQNSNEDSGLLHWDTGSNQASCMDRPSPLSCLTGYEDSITSSTPSLPGFCEPVEGGTGRPSVVVLRAAFPLLSPNMETRGLNSDRVRCLQVGLGGSLPRGTNWWQVDTRGDQVPHQLFGAQSNIHSKKYHISGGYIGTGNVKEIFCLNFCHISCTCTYITFPSDFQFCRKCHFQKCQGIFCSYFWHISCSDTCHLSRQFPLMQEMSHFLELEMSRKFFGLHF